MPPARSPTKRSYRQRCGLAKALDRVGERWTLLIVRNLLVGPQRYGELLAGLPGITTNLLAQRLKEMEANGLVERVSMRSAANAWALTELGRSLEPAIMALGRFGEAYLFDGQDDETNPRWALLSFRRRYRPGAEYVVALDIEGAAFQLRADGHALEVSDEMTWAPQAQARLPFLTLMGMVRFGSSQADAKKSGGLVVEGDARAFTTFLRSVRSAG